MKVLFHIGRGGRFFNPGHKVAKGLIKEFNPEDYGVNIFIDEESGEVRLENGTVVCLVDEFSNDYGSFDIDGHYDTYYWATIDSLDTEELQILFRDLNTWEYLPYLDVDLDLFYLYEEAGRLSELADIIYNEITTEDLIAFGDIFLNEDNKLEFLN